MRYIKLGRTGLDVSPVALGAMSYGEPGRGHSGQAEGVSLRPDAVSPPMLIPFHAAQ